jgi:hypothetical protein
MGDYLRLRGKIYLAKRDSSGNPGGFFYVGNSPKCDLGFEYDVTEHQESTTGQDLVDLRLRKAKKCTLSIMLEDIQSDNLKLLFYGEKVTQASGSYTGSNYDTFPAGLVVGQYVRLAKKNVSTFVLKDSAGTPATLVLNTDYKIVNAKAGIIQILGLGSYTQPFKSQYAYASTETVTFFQGSDSEYFLMQEGLNVTTSPFKECGSELYRVSLDPTKTFELISSGDNASQFEITGSVLRDAARSTDTDFGAFGRWLYLDA